MLKFNTEMCKMGLRGLTVFVSSGDDGVAGFEARGSPSKCGFVPQYPGAILLLYHLVSDYSLANSPYLTTVGATMGPENGGPEVVCQSDKGSIITSGGGFSNVVCSLIQKKRVLVFTLLVLAALLPGCRCQRLPQNQRGASN